MSRLIAGLFLIVFCLSTEALAARFKMSLSKNRLDGIMMDVTPRYPYAADLYVTMSPDLCLKAGTPLPFVDKAAYMHVAEFNRNLDPAEHPTVYFDQDAPAGVNLCYLLVGRGQVELSDWGYRKAEWEEKDSHLRTSGFIASKNRSDGIEITLNPPFTDFSDLYLMPDEDNACPDEGKPFSFTGRWMKAMNEPFNGKYFFHSLAPIGIDLCYFVISRRTKLVVAKTIGYREP